MLNQTCYVLRGADISSSMLGAVPLFDDQVVDGAPGVRMSTLAHDGVMEVGLWEHSEGTSTDIEADEVFVVLSGRATIEVKGGPTLEVGPGDIGFLAAGASTVWTVHEDFRKFYVVGVGER